MYTNGAAIALDSANNLTCTLGSIIIILSLFYKVSLFPLHFVLPDMYEGVS